MKKTVLFVVALLAFAFACGADQIIQYSEKMVGANHPTKADTLNRGFLIEHDKDGLHKDNVITLARLAHLGTAGATVWLRGDGTWTNANLGLLDTTRNWTATQYFKGSIGLGAQGDTNYGTGLIRFYEYPTNGGNYLTLLGADALSNNSTVLTLPTSSGTIGVVVTAPDNAASTGVAGSMSYDNTYLYWCYAANSWRRVAYDNTW